MRPVLIAALATRVQRWRNKMASRVRKWNFVSRNKFEVAAAAATTTTTKGKSNVFRLSPRLRWQHSWTGLCLSEGSAERVHFLAPPISRLVRLNCYQPGFVKDEVCLPSVSVALINVKDQSGTAMQIPNSLYLQTSWHKPGYRQWCAQDNKWSMHWPWIVCGNTVSGAL
jgi:hypothetical protein